MANKIQKIKGVRIHRNFIVVDNLDGSVTRLDLVDSFSDMSICCCAKSWIEFALKELSE